MTKRKAKSSKRAHSGKIEVRAQRNKQAIVRSTKDKLLDSAAGHIEPPELRDLEQQAPIVEKQQSPIVDDRLTSQDRPSQMNVFDFSLAAASMLAPQVKLLDMAQANMRFAFDFSQALAMVRSPFEFFDVIANFTKRRADMMLKMLS